MQHASDSDDSLTSEIVRLTIDKLIEKMGISNNLTKSILIEFIPYLISAVDKYLIDGASKQMIVIQSLLKVINIFIANPKEKEEYFEFISDYAVPIINGAVYLGNHALKHGGCFCFKPKKKVKTNKQQKTTKNK